VVPAKSEAGEAGIEIGEIIDVEVHFEGLHRITTYILISIDSIHGMENKE
jgi:hypothetical protein